MLVSGPKDCLFETKVFDCSRFAGDLRFQIHASDAFTTSILQGEKALKDEFFEPRNVLKDRQKVEKYAQKLISYSAAKRLSNRFVLLTPEEKPEGRITWEFWKLPAANDEYQDPDHGARGMAGYMSMEE